MTGVTDDQDRQTAEPFNGSAAGTAARARGTELELAAARRELTRSAHDLEQLADQLTIADAGRDAALAQATVSQERLRELEQRQRQLVAAQRARVRELEQVQSMLSVTLSEIRRDVDRAAASRAWRWGHFLSTFAWRLRGRQIRTQGALATVIARIDRVQAQSRALPAPEHPASQPTPSPAERRRSSLPLSSAEQAAVTSYRASLAGEIRERIGPPPVLERWPRVSAIVVNRDGRLLLEGLFEGLIRSTDYPDLEVIVVDNGSSDGSVKYLETLTTPFALGVIATGQNLSFAEANAIGAERASGELLLLLNNDVEPFESGWLRELVAALQASNLEAVGATLIHPEPPGAPADAQALVQHRAIAVRWEDSTVRAFNLGDGEPLWEESFGIERRSPAVTAACLLIAGETYARCGGLDRAYQFGTEDVDLGLKLVAGGGELAGVGRAVLVHRESSSQILKDSSFRQLNRIANRRVLLERWGAPLMRVYRQGRLTQDRFWTDGQGPHIAITLTNLDPAAGWGDWYTGHELGDALQALGWRVTYVQRKGDDWYTLPPDLDYVLSLMDPFDLRRVPEHVITIAWIRNWTARWLEREWFDRIDVLLASSGGSIELIKEATGRQAVLFPLATNPARFGVHTAEPDLASDYVYTGNRWGEERAIERAIAPRRGERFRVYGRDWESVDGLRQHTQGPIAYDRLPDVYAGAKLVLDDTQGPTLPYGAVNARVLDALAAGSLPVTDCAAGARELFDAEFPVWTSAETLRSQLDELLRDEPRRQSLVQRYRRVVLREHTYARRADHLRRLLAEQEQRLSFSIKIGAPDRAAAIRWGDLYFAQALARELQRRGHRAIIQTLDEWEDEAGLLLDVALHIKGLSRYHPKPGQVNVLWSISHPAELTGEECDGFDLVCVASSQFAAQLREQTATPVVVLEQATDPGRFRPDPQPELEHELVYVANSRNVLRPVMRALIETDYDVAVWGANWSGLIPDSYVVAEHAPNHELRQIYSSGAIVLCDHWEDMRVNGFISNRVYDALACGAFVLSDDVVGLRERFGDAVPTYRSDAELREQIGRFLQDPDERRRRAERGREIVLAGNTFAHATDTLIHEVKRHSGDRASLPRPGS